jgi:hypothetical protein
LSELPKNRLIGKELNALLQYRLIVPISLPRAFSRPSRLRDGLARIQLGFGQGEAFGRDASGQSANYFAECFAPTAISIVPVAEIATFKFGFKTVFA